MFNAIKRCDLTAQYQNFRAPIRRIMDEVLTSGNYVLGKQGQLLEREFADYIGCKFGVSVASGTDALILSLKAAGLRNGDKVITSTYAPSPVATAIILAGGAPIFVDINPETCLMSLDDLEKKITKTVKFIVSVHLFGSVCNMQDINQIGKDNNITCIEDASQAHGSTFMGKKAGSFGVLSCFSFYPTKNLGAYGDGGIILTNNTKIKEMLIQLRNYGKKKNDVFNSKIVGFNSRLDEIQAAVLRFKLRHLDHMNQKRYKLFSLYKKELENTPLSFLKVHSQVKSNLHLLNVFCKKNRSQLQKYLEQNKIQTNVYYPTPLHGMPAFKKYVTKNEKFPNSERVTKQILALPMYPELTIQQVKRITHTINHFFKNKNESR